MPTRVTREGEVSEPSPAYRPTQTKLRERIKIAVRAVRRARRFLPIIADITLSLLIDMLVRFLEQDAWAMAAIVIIEIARGYIGGKIRENRRSPKLFAWIKRPYLSTVGLSALDHINILQPESLRATPGLGLLIHDAKWRGHPNTILDSRLMMWYTQRILALHPLLHEHATHAQADRGAPRRPDF